MGKYRIKLQPTAEKHLSTHKRSGNKGSLKKIQGILEELELHYLPPNFSATKTPKTRYILGLAYSAMLDVEDVESQSG